MKLLTFAHRGEAQAFLAAYSFKPVDFFFDGLLKSDDSYLLITGEGPHIASEKTITVLASFHAEITYVYNLGVAGSLNSKFKKYDLLWIRTAYAHHADKCEFKSYSSLNPQAVNDCMTAYSRILNLAEKMKLAHFANLVDRELWAVASAAQLFKKSYQSLKIISDEMHDGEICQFIKEEAALFSEKLLLEFQRAESTESAENILPPKKTSEKKQIPFIDDEQFYFTISQERKLQSLLEGLRLKGLSDETLINAPEIKTIKESEKSPKDKTRLLLLFLSDQLNPISVKIRKSVDEILSPLHEAKIAASFDPDFEEDWLSLNLKIQSSRDLEKAKNALKIFSYEDFKKILDGHFDV